MIWSVTKLNLACVQPKYGVCLTNLLDTNIYSSIIYGKTASSGNFIQTGPSTSINTYTYES